MVMILPRITQDVRSERPKVAYKLSRMPPQPPRPSAQSIDSMYTEPVPSTQMTGGNPPISATSLIDSLCTKPVPNSHITSGSTPTVPWTFPSRNFSGGTEIVVPNYIYIKDRQGRYLILQESGVKNENLTFRSMEPDLNCVFEVTPSNNSPGYIFKTVSTRRPVGIRYDQGPHFYYVDSYSTTVKLLVIPISESVVYFQEDNITVLKFMSNQLTAHGSPLGRDFINKDSEMEIVIAAAKREIVDVEYNINDGLVREAPPLIALSTAVRNDSNGDVNQTLTYTYEKWSVGTWNNVLGVELGGKMTFKAGVPFVVSAQFEISLSGAYAHEWGGEEGVRQVVTSSTTVTVPPKKKARAMIIVRNAELDVAFTYTQRTVWADGNSEEQKKNGIYNNVDSWHVDVVLDDWEEV